MAGITINALTGSDSAPAKANEAEQKNDIGSAKDQISLTATNAKLAAYDTAYVGNGISGTEASNSVGRTVIKAVAEQIQANNQVGKATITITGFGTLDNINNNATITISTRDFEVVGTITIRDGILTWGEIEANVPSIIITAADSTTVATNGTVQLYAEFRKMNSTTLTWASSVPAVATVDNTGLVTVVSETGGATANITATGNGVTSNTITITVKETPRVATYKQQSIAYGVSAVSTKESVTLYDAGNKAIKIPKNFGIATDSATTIAEGIVIEDASKDTNNQPTATTGNQYVWVDVPRTKDVVYSETILAYDLDNLTGTDLDNAYNAIEGAMQIYASEYRTLCKEQKSDGTGYRDEYNSNMGTIGNITSSNYNIEKREMLKSVFENGGFWVGRFEAGIATANTRTQKTDSFHPFDSTIKPLTQANVAPLNFVTCSEAQTLAKNVAPSGYTSSLMFGIQWDLMLKFLNAGTGNSTSWGNYNGQSFTVNTSAKGYNDSLKVYEDIASYSKTGRKLLTTGATLGAASNANRNSKANIHDVAGNVCEYTLEYTSNTSKPCCLRGGNYGVQGSYGPAFFRDYRDTSLSLDCFGFRVTLY